MFNTFEIPEYNIKNIINDYIKNDFMTNELYTLISENNVYISGSMIHKHLSKSSYEISDMDLYITKEEYEKINYYKLFRKINLYNKKINDKLNYYYNFSKLVAKCIYFTDDQNLYTINLIIVNTKDIGKFIYEDTPFTFLKNYYYNGIMHYLTDNTLIENIYDSNVLSEKYHPIINKYLRRNVKFNIRKLYHGSVRINFENIKEMLTKYYDLGFVVIPLNKTDLYMEGKMPTPALWTDLESNYRFKIKQNDPYNIGIVCGEQSGIICIDVDQKDNGVLHFNNLVKKYGLPVGPYQKTPNNGFHYIFKYNKEKMKNMKSQIKCLEYNYKKVGIDFWIKNVQFVVEPSINRQNNKEYKWIVEPTKDNIPELPDWCYDMHNSKYIDKDYNFNNPVKKESSFEWIFKYFT